MKNVQATHPRRSAQALSITTRQVFDRPQHPSDTVVGVCAIARHLGTHYVKAAGRLETGRIPGARRVGKRWTAPRTSLALFPLYSGLHNPAEDAPALRVACKILDCFRLLPRMWFHALGTVMVCDGDDEWRPLMEAEIKTMAIDAARALKLGQYISPQFLDDVAALAIVEAHRRG